MSKRTLLLADDSITIQKVVNLTFADEGIEVISVSDGNSAMDKLREDTPDLVLADVNMPGLNGYEICEKIKQSDSTNGTPVILLVGSFEPFDEDEAERVGADDYLTKPFQSISQLVDKVTELLKIEEDENLEDTAEIPFAGDDISTDNNKTEAVFENGSDSFGQLSDDFDDEMIQTDQVGSIPVNDALKYESDSDIPRFVGEEKASGFEVVEQSVETVSDHSTEEEMEDAFAEESSDNEEKDFLKTQPLTNEEYKELSVNEPIVEEEPEDFESMDSEVSETVKEKITSEEPFYMEESPGVDSEEKIFAETESFEPSQDSVETAELPMPEVASILELDEINLLDLPPLEGGEELDESLEESDETDSSETDLNLVATNESEAVQDKEPLEEEISEDDSESIEEKAEVSSQTDEEETEKSFADTAEDENLSETEKAIDKAVSPEMVEVITKKVVERLSERAVRDIAWEVVPQLADLIIKKMAEEKMKE